MALYKSLVLLLLLLLLYRSTGLYPASGLVAFPSRGVLSGMGSITMELLRLRLQLLSEFYSRLRLRLKLL